MLCREAIFHDLLDFDSYKDGPAPSLHFTVPFFSLNMDIRSSISGDFKTYSRIAASYSHRKLKYEFDALNAVTGILSRLSRVFETHFVEALPLNDWHNSLLWFHHPHHGYYRTCSRRSEFPSWSWLGWNIRVEYAMWLVPGLTYIDTKDTVATKCMSVHSLVDGPTLYRDLVRVEKVASYCVDPRDSKILAVTTDVARISIQKVPYTEDEHLEHPNSLHGDRWQLLLPSDHDEHDPHQFSGDSFVEIGKPLALGVCQIIRFKLSLAYHGVFATITHRLLSSCFSSIGS